MQKRSHRLLATSLLAARDGFCARRFEWAFLLGSVQPDCNPLTYLKGSRRAYRLRGHNFSNSRPYIHRRIHRLQNRRRWNIWHYYTLGKLTHYLADAFTYPHNETYPESLLEHRRYEKNLRLYLADALPRCTPRPEPLRTDLTAAIDELHRQYLESLSDMRRDVQYALRALNLLMALCCPTTA